MPIYNVPLKAALTFVGKLVGKIPVSAQVFQSFGVDEVVYSEEENAITIISSDEVDSELQNVTALPFKAADNRVLKIVQK